MIVELGHVALVLAFALAVIQSIVPLWGTLTNDDRLMATSDTSSLGILLFCCDFLCEFDVVLREF